MQLKIHHNCQTLSLQLVCTFFNLHNIYAYIHMFYTNKVHSFYFITCLLVAINSDIEYNALVQYSRFFPHQQSTSYLFDFCVKYYSTVRIIRKNLVTETIIQYFYTEYEKLTNPSELYYNKKILHNI